MNSSSEFSELTTFIWPVEYTRMIVNTVIARRSEKLCATSQ